CDKPARFVDSSQSATAGFRGGSLNNTPRLGIGHQRRKNCMIELMATANSLIGSKQWLASECKIPNGVEYLVANEFIGKPQALGIEHAVLAHNECVLE